MSTIPYPQAPPVATPQPSVLAKPSTRADQLAQTLLTALLYAAPALIAVHAANVSDPDIWWHLRTGEWIVQHHTIPHTDLYSSATTGQPWAAYSWLFELLTFQLFHRLGLTGIVAYTAGMLVAITAALHHLIKRLQADFSLGVLLTFAACFSMGRLYTPRSWLFTILFFILELNILMQARRTGRIRELFWLPVIFAIWANTHIQFIDGLVVLCLVFAESLLDRWRSKTPNLILPLAIGAALGASLLATLANPYGWHLYKVAHDLASQPGVLNKVTELQAIPFRSLADYLVLAFALASAAVLARSRRFLPFETALLVFATFISFRSQRDVWVVVIAACAILASRIDISRQPQQRLPAFTAPIIVALALLGVLFGFRTLQVNNQRLAPLLANDLPVHAVEFVQSHHYSGPVYNDYAWGGYLIWSLRQPVSIDGRAALYGDQRMDRSASTWHGEPNWNSDPALQAAGVVIAPIKVPLTQLLRSDSHFQLAYEDKVAAVFIPRNP